MSPHKVFLLFLGCATLVSILAFLKDTDEIISMLQTLALAGIVLAVILVLTRRYWKNARRVSS